MTWRRGRIEAIRSLEALAGKEFFHLDPYAKFLPLILQPPELVWENASRCDPASRRRIMIPAYGRDPLALAGWTRFAVIAAYSLLHCRGIEGWGVDLLLGGQAQEYRDLPLDGLFDQPVEPQLQTLSAHGVAVRTEPLLVAPGDVYRLAEGEASLILRMDADSVCFPGVLKAPCFCFDHPLGHSGLNHRHTGRSALRQLVHPAQGRMRSWPTALQATAPAWAEAVAAAAARVLGVHSCRDAILTRLEAIPWPSEGLSYLQGEALASFAGFQEELIRSGVTPAWDEESAKAAFIATLDLSLETCQTPVLEFWEAGPQTPDSATVNLRNAYSQAAAIRALLDRGDDGGFLAAQVFDAVTEVQRRSDAGGAP